MLVLSRRPGERIHIGDSIDVVVLRMQGGRVHLGIDAPADVDVQREEVRRRIPAEVGKLLRDRPWRNAGSAAPRSVRARQSDNTLDA